MIGSALTLWLLLLAMPAQMLTPGAQRVDSLHVLSRDPALGDEVARAARRYLHRPTQVRKDSESEPQPDSDGIVRLLVQTDSSTEHGLRCLLTLSQGTRSLKRSLQLRETPNHIDLAEAIAIELPALLSLLSEQGIAQSPNPAPVSATIPPLRRASPPMGNPMPARSAVLAKSAARSHPARTASEPSEASATSPTETENPTTEPAARATTKTEPDPVLAMRSPAPTQAVSTIPASIPKDSVPTDSGSKDSAANSPEEKTPKETVAIQASDAKTPELFVAASKSDPVKIRRPAGAVGLLLGGGALLLAGVGTGIETLLVAKQVSQPTADGHFDKQLDQQGKTLSAVTIALDSVGGAALLAGSVWLYVHTQRAAKLGASKRRVAVAPLVQKAGMGMLSEVRF